MGAHIDGSFYNNSGAAYNTNHTFFNRILYKEKGYITEGGVSGLSFIMVNVCAPATIFTSLQIEYSKESLISGTLMIFYYIAVMLLGLLIAFILSEAFKISGNEKKVWLAGGMLFNSVFIGLPIIKALYGDAAVFYLCFGVIGWNLIAYTLGIGVLIDDGEKLSFGKFLAKALRSPAVAACFAGFAVFAFKVRLPVFLFSAARYMSQTTIALSMIVLGAIVSRSPLKGMFSGASVYVFSFIRLIIMPLVALFIFKMVITDEIAMNTVVLGAALPVGTMVPVFAEQVGSCGEIGAKYCIVSTILSVFSLPVVSFIISLA